MAEPRVTVVGVDRVQDFLRGVPIHLTEQARDAIRESVFRVHQGITNRIRNGPLYSRTGRLRRSFKTEVSKAPFLGDIYGRVSTDVKYAPVHEEGATIRAKNAYTTLPGGPYLNIPSSLNKTPAGVTRNSAREVFSRGGHIRPLRSAPRADYAVFLGDQPMFWLVKQVTIPARLQARKTAEDEVPTLLANLRALINEDNLDG
jgi:hypothetical protein